MGRRRMLFVSALVGVLLGTNAGLPLQEVAAATYSNCEQAALAGRTNIKWGEPDYSPALDRDNDGIACEADPVAVDPNQIKVDEVKYTAVPVVNGWDYSVWSDYQYGSRLGSMNDLRLETVWVYKEADVAGVRMAYFTSRKMSGWVAKAALIQGEYIDWAKRTPGPNAGDYGIWTHFRDGKFVAKLSDYRGRTLSLHHVVGDWAIITVGDQNIGWVSLHGLVEINETNRVNYIGIPVANGWDYSVWSDALNGNRLGSLNVLANELLTISEATVVNGVEMVHFTSPGDSWGKQSLSGWVAKSAIHDGVTLIDGVVNYSGVSPVVNAGDFGVWSHFSGGQRLGSLSTYYGKKLTAVLEVQDWVLFKYGTQTIGWVHETGLYSSNKFQRYKQVVPVYNSWDYGVWSDPYNGTRIGSLYDFRDSYLRLSDVTLDGNWVEIYLPGDQGILGWVGSKGVIPPEDQFFAYTGVAVLNAWDYSVWSDLGNGTRLGSMNDYPNTLVTVIGENANGSMVQFMVDDHIIGWVSVDAIEAGKVPDTQ